jgi:hypothetical protein
MAHRYILGTEVSDAAEYRVILSTVTLDDEAHSTWLALVRVLGGAFPTSLVRVELLELAATHVFYLESGDINSVDFEDFNTLADILMQGSGMEEKEEGASVYGEVMILLSEIFEGYMKMMLHIRKRFKINRESIQHIEVQRLTNVVTNNDSYTDDGSSSFVLIMT